jgi:hypothetical protein
MNKQIFCFNRNAVNNLGNFLKKKSLLFATMVLGTFGVQAQTITLTPVSTGFNQPIGIDHHTPTNDVIMSANYPNGSPYNFNLVAFDGTKKQFSTISGLTDEIKIATGKPDCNGLSLGGFTPGELFVGTGTPGHIARVSADGNTILNPWVALPNEAGLMRGSLYHDRTGVFGGDLIAATTDGGIWRIKSNGTYSLITRLAGVHLEGLTTVPNDPKRYGPWAGKIIVGAEQLGNIYAVSTTGVVTTHQIGINPEDIDIVPGGQNFFAVNYAGNTVVGAGPAQFSGMEGDILIAQESPGLLFRVKWSDSTQSFKKTQIAAIDQFEHMTFTTAGIFPIPDVCIKMEACNQSVKLCTGQSVQLNITAINTCDQKCGIPDKPTVSCSTGCTRSISGTAAQSIAAGTTVCIQAGQTFSGGLDLNGGTLVVCGTLAPAYMNYNSGHIIVLGTANFQWFNMNNAASSLKNYGTVTFEGLSFSGRVENHKNMTVNYDLNVNPGATFINSGDLTVKQSFNNNSTAENRGIINITRDLKNNSGGNFLNKCQINVSNEFHIAGNSTFTNERLVMVTNSTFLNGGGKYVAKPASRLETKNMTMFTNGSIIGDASSCAVVKVNNTSVINGGASITGKIDYCDPNGIETKGIIFPSSVTTNCSCATTTPGVGAPITYKWTPSTGLNNPNIANPIANPSLTTTYTVTATNANGNVATSLVTVVVGPCNREGDMTETAEASKSAHPVIAYPNPSKGDVTLEVAPEFRNSTFNILIVDEAGKVVVEDKISGALKVNDAQMKPGIYFLKVQEGTNEWFEKIVKQ